MALRIFSRSEKLVRVLSRNLSKSTSGMKVKLQEFCFMIFGMMTFTLTGSEQIISH